MDDDKKKSIHDTEDEEWDENEVKNNNTLNSKWNQIVVNHKTNRNKYHLIGLV